MILHTIMLKMLQPDRVQPDHFALGLSILGKTPGRPESRPARLLASQQNHFVCCTNKVIAV